MFIIWQELSDITDIPSATYINKIKDDCFRLGSVFISQSCLQFRATFGAFILARTDHFVALPAFDFARSGKHFVNSSCSRILYVV